MESAHTNPLVVGLAAGDERAFAALYDQYAVRLYRAALGMLGRREDAEDAVHEVFAAVLQSSHNLPEVKNLTAYLFTALRRAAGRSAARRMREPRTGEAAIAEIAAKADTEMADGTLPSIPPGNPSILIPLYRVFLLGDDLAAHARFTARLETAAGLSYDQANAFLQQFDKELHAEPGGVLTASLMPSMRQAVGSAARAEARLGAARLGLALCAYRARHGQLPGTLDDLVPDFIPAVPRDPFDGQAMKFKRTGHGAVVYSIGPDMTDDGGAPFDREKKTGDITFTVP